MAGYSETGQLKKLGIAPGVRLDVLDVALPTGLVDVKVAAIDADWSGLKLGWQGAALSLPRSAGARRN